MSGIEVDGVQLPVTNVLSLRPGVNRAPRKITLRRFTMTKQLGAPRIENLVGGGPSRSDLTPAWYAATKIFHVTR
jgi:hypothetical protein